MGLGARPASGWSHLNILTLVTSAEALIPDKFTFGGSGWICLFGDTIQSATEHMALDIPIWMAPQRPSETAHLKG